MFYSSLYTGFFVWVCKYSSMNTVSVDPITLRIPFVMGYFADLCRVNPQIFVEQKVGMHKFCNHFLTFMRLTTQYNQRAI
jgi:hypothetical protein